MAAPSKNGSYVDWEDLGCVPRSCRLASTFNQSRSVVPLGLWRHQAIQATLVLRDLV